jgi:hypothetical protein
MIDDLRSWIGVRGIEVMQVANGNSRSRAVADVNENNRRSERIRIAIWRGCHVDIGERFDAARMQNSKI